ncbi:MAG: GatB/YqeY domain-containing protein [Chloroflexi bacterium]|nr:GatB/YqeY domain-containing protein [Chloroflexota bacterium]
MTLQERIQQDQREAMRRGDTLRRDTLRLVQSALQYEAISKGKPLEAAEVQAVLQKQAKQRRESIEEFRKGRREDLATKEQAELAIILEYLPAQMGREEIAALARQAIQEAGARGPADRGKVMGRLMPQVRGKADGALVNMVVTELLEAQARS